MSSLMDRQETKGMQRETRMEKRIREDLRAIREASGFTLEEIGEIFGWERAAVSKIELGHRKVRLADYLRIVDFCRDAIPDHPALALLDLYAPRKGRTRSPHTAPADE